jgi:protease IV
MSAKRLVWFVALLIGVLFAQPAPAQIEQLLKKVTEGMSKPAPPPNKQVAVFRVEGALTETPVNMPPLFGGKPPMSMQSLLHRLKEARQDPHVVAVVMDLQHATLGMAQVEEISAALRKFAVIDKDVFVHADMLTNGTYAASSGASYISLVPTGDLWLTGLYSESPFLRGTLEKLGCEPDFIQFEQYKTAAEMVMRKGPSPQAEEMMNWLLDGIFDGMVKLIAEGRNLTTDQVRMLIDNGPYSAEDALKAGLIDAVQHRQDFVASLKKRFDPTVDFVTDYADDSGLKIPDDNIFAAFEFLMNMFNPKPKVYTKASVAIVYVEGAIMPGEAEPSPFGSTGGAFSTSIRKALDKAAEERTVKAVVLRVDSPGGSALASEIILDASRRVAAKKPLIVSMGNVAGSGGYYVTCGAETIFVDANTITGSIGVLGGKIVTTGMWEKIGVNWHSNQRGEMAAMMSSASRFSDKERKKIHAYMASVYEIFKDHVAKARGERLAKPIGELAGGRVYTGAQALELGLVDRIGGLEDAISFAARRAGISDYEIRIIPEPKSIFDLFAAPKSDEYTSVARGPAGLSLTELPLFEAALPALAKLDPLRFAAMLRALQRIELIHREGVIMMMPDEYVIR